MSLKAEFERKTFARFWTVLGKKQTLHGHMNCTNYRVKLDDKHWSLSTTRPLFQLEFKKTLLDLQWHIRRPRCVGLGWPNTTHVTINDYIHHLIKKKPSVLNLVLTPAVARLLSLLLPLLHTSLSPSLSLSAHMKYHSPQSAGHLQSDLLLFKNFLRHPSCYSFQPVWCTTSFLSAWFIMTFSKNQLLLNEFSITHKAQIHSHGKMKTPLSHFFP